MSHPFDATRPGPHALPGGAPPRVLPRWLAGFVGRERERVEISTILSDADVRLLTLTGPGGVGKTRLAVEVARDREEDYPDGTWFVPLSLTHGASAVPATVARALGIHQSAAQPDDAIAEVLRPTRGLLILDNFEHVLPASSLISDLMAYCPALVILVTSRMPLNISGERTYHVPPLALPASGDSSTVEAVMASDAVSLFLHRSRGHGEDLRLTSRNAEAVADICRSLDGLPLAIELAAPWLRVLSPAAILERLSNRLDLLESGPRDAPTRQRTMRATIDWSYVLLTLGAKSLLRHLSVFVGGIPIDGIEAITASDAGVNASPLDHLGSLIDHNLVRKMPVLPGNPDWEPPRFMVMGTIREFAFEQLALAGEDETLRDRHAEWCVTLAEKAERGRIELGASGFAERLVAERHNTRAAIEWLEHRGDITGALRLVTTLWPLWLEHGELTEGRTHLERLLTTVAATANRAVWARAKVALGVLLQAQGEPAAEHAISEALPVLASLDDHRTMGVALTTLGLVEMVRGNPSKATRLLEEALGDFQAVGDLRAGSWALRHLSSVSYRRGDIDGYERRAAEGLSIVGPAASPRDLARLGANLAQAATRRGVLSDAKAQFEVVLAQYRQVDDQWGEADVLQRLEHLAWLRDDREVAADLFDRSAQILRRIGDPEGMSRVLTSEGWLARKAGDLDLATRRFSEAALLAGHHGAKRPLAKATLGKGVIELDFHRESAAAAQLRRSLELTVEIGDPLATTEVLEWCARLGSSADVEDAARLIGATTAHRRTAGIPMEAPFIAEYGRFAQRLRYLLGGERFEAAMAAGSATPLQAARDTASVILDSAERSAFSDPSTGNQPSDEAQAALSQREIDVLRLLALGHSDKDMADALFISRRTVASHVSHIYNKIGVSSRAAAAAWAVRNGVA